MFSIAKIIAGLFGWDISKVQRWVIIGTGILLVILLIAIGLWVKSCVSRRHAKIGQQTIEKINKADEKERKAELQKVIEDNADVVRTVNDRNTIAESDETNRNLDIYHKIQDADEKIAAAKRQGRDVTGSELDCMLTGVCQ